jgi:hypothetical protein
MLAATPAPILTSVSPASSHPQASGPQLKLFYGWLCQNLLGGLDPDEGLAASIPAVMNARILIMRSRTEGNAHRWIAWRSIMPNDTSTRFSHDPEVGVKWIWILGVGREPGPHLGMLMGGVVVHDQMQLLGLPPERSNPNFSPSLPRWRAGDAAEPGLLRRLTRRSLRRTDNPPDAPVMLLTAPGVDASLCPTGGGSHPRPICRDNGGIKMGKRTLAVAAVCVAMLIGSAGTASAQDCYIANRSAKGNEGATNSDRWVTVTVEEFTKSPDFPPGVDPTCFLGFWTDNGGPDSFTVRSDKVIGAGSSNPNLANGKGLEHIEEAFGPLIGQAIEACPATA